MNVYFILFCQTQALMQVCHTSQNKSSILLVSAGGLHTDLIKTYHSPKIENIVFNNQESLFLKLSDLTLNS